MTLAAQRPDGSPRQGLWCVVMVLLALLIIFTDTALNQAPMFNNGDQSRVVGDWVELPHWQFWEGCKHVQWQSGLPRSTGAAFFGLTASLHHVLGVCMLPQANGWLLALIMLTGVLAVWLAGGLGFWPALAMVLAALAFAPMMFSHYQEAVLLPLLPWCLLALHGTWRGARLVMFAVVGVLVLAVKAQMALMLPFLLCTLWLAWRRGDAKLLPALACGALFTVVACSLLFVQRHFGEANSYNRFFNGMGWAIEGVANWPAKTFNDRQAYFEARRQTLQALSAGLEPASGQRWMGSSYWPDGIRLKSTPAWRNVAPSMSAGHWLAQMAGSPALAWAWVTTVWQVTVGSSYTLNYLSPPASSNALLHPVREVMLAHAGWFWLLSLLVLCVQALRKSSWPRWALTAWISLLPLLVVAGDGFYEFEKHLLTYLVCLPLIAMAMHGGRVNGPSPKDAS